MTLERAIELLHPGTTGKAIEAFETKEEALEAITEACMIACDTMRKQIPYKPKEYEDKFYACKCGNCVLYKWEHYPDVLTPKEIEGLPYCLACGQKLDWREEV